MDGQYRVWCTSARQDEDDCELVVAYDHEEAARQFAEDTHNNDPFSDAIEVSVRSTFGGDNGELKRFTIHPEPSVYFYVYETEE